MALFSLHLGRRGSPYGIGLNSSEWGIISINRQSIDFITIVIKFDTTNYDQIIESRPRT